MITLLLYMTKQQLCLKMTWHPASQSFTTEISACVFNDGKMCPSLAFCGSMSQSRSHSSVDLHLLPFGMTTVTGLDVGRRLRTFDCMVRKWSVAPESRRPCVVSWLVVDAEVLLVTIVFSSSSLLENKLLTVWLILLLFVEKGK